MGGATWRWGLVCWLLSLGAVFGGEARSFSGDVRASLFFREDATGKFGYPHFLLAYLRLENVSDDVVSWTCDSPPNIEAELFDGKGKSVSQAPTAGTTVSPIETFCLPPGSRLDWMISRGAVFESGDTQDQYLLVIGGSDWLIPQASASSYSLKIRLKGPSEDICSEKSIVIKPGSTTVTAEEFNLTPSGKDSRLILLDVPATPLVISPD